MLPYIDLNKVFQKMSVFSIKIRLKRAHLGHAWPDFSLTLALGNWSGNDRTFNLFVNRRRHSLQMGFKYKLPSTADH